MKFKAKIFKLGNSKAIYIPKSIYKDLENIEYEWEVHIKGVFEEKIEAPVYTKPVDKPKFNSEWCSKHSVFKGTCGCK